MSLMQQRQNTKIWSQLIILCIEDSVFYILILITVIVTLSHRHTPCKKIDILIPQYRTVLNCTSSVSIGILPFSYISSCLRRPSGGGLAALESHLAKLYHVHYG